MLINFIDFCLLQFKSIDRADRDAWVSVLEMASRGIMDNNRRSRSRTPVLDIYDQFEEDDEDFGQVSVWHKNILRCE